MGVPVGWGQWRWRARLTCHLGILRLMSRGLERSRRLGLRRRHSRMIARAQPALVASGGKIARLSERASGDPQGGGEADPVRVDVGLVGGLEHEGADGVVAAQVAPHLLFHQSR